VGGVVTGTDPIDTDFSIPTCLPSARSARRVGGVMHGTDPARYRPPAVGAPALDAWTEACALPPWVLPAGSAARDVAGHDTTHASSATRRRQAVGTDPAGTARVSVARFGAGQDTAHASSAARRRQQVGAEKSVPGTSAPVTTATKALNAEPPDR
jgi:hypothetical protein